MDFGGGVRDAKLPGTRIECVSHRRTTRITCGSQSLTTKGEHRALCPPCAKSRLFPTAGSHGSQGPEVGTSEAVLNGSCTLLSGGGLQGCSRDEQRNYLALCENAP